MNSGDGRETLEATLQPSYLRTRRLSHSESGQAQEETVLMVLLTLWSKGSRSGIDKDFRGPGTTELTFV